MRGISTWPTLSGQLPLVSEKPVLCSHASEVAPWVRYACLKQGNHSGMLSLISYNFPAQAADGGICDRVILNCTDRVL